MLPSPLTKDRSSKRKTVQPVFQNERLEFQTLPPGIVVFQVLGEPGEDDLLPSHALFVVHNDMVLAIDLHIFHLLAENFQRGVELLALVGRYVGIYGAVEQEQRGLDFVCAEQGRLLDIERGVVPGEAAILRTLAVGVAPISPTPVAGDVADAGVGNGCGEEVGAGLKILRHEAAVGSTHATDFGSIDKGVFFAELTGAFNDVLRSALAPGIDVAGGKFLTVADATARVDDIDHVALTGKHLHGILIFQTLRGGRAAAVVIDNHGIFLRLIEIGWEEEETVDGVASGGEELPVAATSDGNVADTLFKTERTEGFHTRCRGVQLANHHVACTLSALPERHEVRVLALSDSHGEAGNAFDGNTVALDRAALGIQREDAATAGVICHKIDLTVAARPLIASDGGFETRKQGFGSVRCDVVEIKTIVKRIGIHVLSDFTAKAVEGSGRSGDEQAGGVGRIDSRGDESRVGEKRVHLAGVGIHFDDGSAFERHLGRVEAGVAKQEFFGILRNV